MRRLLIVGTVIGIAGGGCSAKDECSPLMVRTTPQLDDADTVVVLGGKPLRLEPDLWLGVGPQITSGCGSPPQSCLLAGFQVEAADSSSFPDGVQVTAAWVAFDTRAWSTTIEGAPAPPRARAVVARGGPHWAPGTVVDAVVRLVHADTTVLLAARDRTITPVY